MKSFLFIVLLLTVNLCQGDNTWFVDKNYVYEKGSSLSQLYLKKHAPAFAKHIEELQPWMVRIEVQHSFEGNSRSVNHGTGVLLKGGVIATAKHVITKNVKPENSEVRIYVTTIKGEVFEASVTQKGDKDWAILKLKNLHPHFNHLLNSPVKVSAPKQNESCVFFGYPARLGLDAEGKVQSFHKGDAEAGIPVSKLFPMVIVGKAVDLKAMKLDPLAGFPPVGGMSGGPIFNLKGELVAVQHSVSITTEDATGKVIGYGIGATSTSDIPTLAPFMVPKALKSN